MKSIKNLKREAKKGFFKKNDKEEKIKNPSSPSAPIVE